MAQTANDSGSTSAAQPQPPLYPAWAVVNPYAAKPDANAPQPQQQSQQEQRKHFPPVADSGAAAAPVATVPNVAVATSPAAAPQSNPVPLVKLEQAASSRDLAVPPIDNSLFTEPKMSQGYQSPPPIIHKEVVHMGLPQSEADKARLSSVIPPVASLQMEKMVPTAGDNSADSGAGSPLPPPASPPQPAQAAMNPPPPVNGMPAPASSPTPTAISPAIPLANVKPLLPLQPLPQIPAVAVSAPVPASAPAPVPPAAATAAAAGSTPFDAVLKSVGNSAAKTAATPAQANAVPANGATPKVNAAAVPSLSVQSKQVLSHVPSGLNASKPPVAGPIDINRLNPDLADPEVKAVRQEGMDISVAQKNNAPKIDATYQLEQAYNALTAGQTSEAVGIYKNVLSNDPANKSALFGLAATYQQVGQNDLARPLYAKLLSLDPGNRDGLNNFLALLADDAPQEALKQLQALEIRNPQFSPIPAQMAVIYTKLGNLDMASQKMFRAMELSPENLTYRYNLAIMFDKQKKYNDAAKLYREIVKAWQNGEAPPGNIDEIQQRLTFISSNRG